MPLCECGCGEEVSEGKRFLRGHHRRVNLNQPREVSEEEMKQLLRRLKVHIYPSFGEQDKGDGGVRRVVEAQIKHLGAFGIEVVPTAEEADVIACHITVPPTYLKLYPQKPLIAMCHGLYWKEYEWENWAYKANADVINLIRIADAVTAPSEWVANAIRRHTSRPVHVIPHGVDAKEWQPDDPMDYVLWNKTRPDPVCDPMPVTQLARMLPDINFVSTFGDSTLPNLHLTGRLGFDDAKKLVQRAAVYLCTSRETFGIGTLEAMACGIPVVGFRWGAQAEFLQHGVDGYLAAPGDIEDLARGIEWAIKNRETAGKFAQQKAYSFTWENAAKQYADLFSKVYESKNKQQPRTSIIVTNYNLHDYLDTCLASVFNQSDPDWECIIVDDASPDERGRKIAELYCSNDERFKLITNEENQYLAESRNIGIRAAQGRYILPLDADDYLPKDAVGMLAKQLDTDRNIHIAYGNVRFVEEDGETRIQYNPRYDAGHSGWPMPYVFEMNMQFRNLLPYSSMYRKEVWKDIGGYRRRQRTAEDAEFWTRAASYGFRPKFATDQDTLVYRVRQNSMSASQPQTDWLKWFTWARDPELLPAGAVTKEQYKVTSYEPLLVSVVIPVGPGHERYVQDAVDSVEAQTFQNWECIVVNDTGGQLPELPSWVRVVETSGKTGAAHARNAGIAASRAKVFLPLDADDYLEPVALKAMFDTYLQTKDIIYSDFWDTDQNGNITGVHECDDYDPTLISGRKRTVRGEVREGMIHSVTALTPKEAWEAVGGYDESLPAWEDWDFAMAVADKGYCSRRVGYPLFTYRKNTGIRREDNFINFDRSKEGILSKWGKIWEGGYELMACRSCGAKKPTAYPLNSVSMNGVASQKVASNDGAVLIQYTGLKAGAMPYRGTSGTTYWFSSGDPVKYVLSQDVAVFMNRSDFKLAEEVQNQANFHAPMLTVER